MKKITIETVAKRAGVSTAAVSYVLSGKKKISPEVTRRIKDAIEELDYTPSVIARNLASRKTWTAGLYMSSTKNIRNDLFFNSILAGILDELHKKEYQLHLYADNLSEESEKHSDLSMTQPIDGAIIMNPRINDLYLEYLKKQKIPFVVIGTPSHPEKTFYVDVDLTAAAFTATNYLISKGHDKILFINGPASYMQSIHHIRGAELAFRENGMRLDTQDIKNIQMAEDESYKLFSENPDFSKKYTAVLAFHDVFSIGIFRFLKEKRIQVPQDMGFVSLGNSPFCRISSPPLTSIDLAPYEMGGQAAEMLIDIIEKRRIQPSHTIVPAELIVRDSV